MDNELCNIPNKAIAGKGLNSLELGLLVNDSEYIFPYVFIMD